MDDREADEAPWVRNLTDAEIAAGERWHELASALW
jgi:hypothetical protein